MTKLHVGQLALRLVEKFGDEALAVATRQAEAYSRSGDAISYADWCLVVGEVEALKHRMSRRRA
jgi:hypothetical protein